MGERHVMLSIDFLQPENKRSKFYALLAKAGFEKIEGLSTIWKTTIKNSLCSEHADYDELYTAVGHVLKMIKNELDGVPLIKLSAIAMIGNSEPRKLF